MQLEDQYSSMANETNQAYQIALVSAIGVTCILSIIGSSAIIVSFLAFKQLRTTMRYLLFNLSIADFITAVTNLFGVLYSLKFLNNETLDQSDDVCVAQAAVGLVGVNASILWTVVFIVYIYVLLACYRPTPCLNTIILVIVTLVTWIIPIVVVTVFVALEYFGFEKNYSPAFCTIDVHVRNRTELYREIIGYESFLYFSFTVLPILSFIFVIHLSYIKKKHFTSDVSRYRSRLVTAAEIKLVFVPLLFLLIRIWGLVLDIVTFYVPSDDRLNFRHIKAHVVFLFLAGVGDSAQGFVNGVLFVLLTETVRYKLAKGCIKVLCCFGCCNKLRWSSTHSWTISPTTFSYRAAGAEGAEVLEESLIAQERDSDSVMVGRWSTRTLSDFSAESTPYYSINDD